MLINSTYETGRKKGGSTKYILHGTTSLIASRDVGTGEILAPMIHPHVMK
jgi:hypothetical protein